MPSASVRWPRRILVANNLRDIPTDTEHGKRTLAVRLGDPRTRLLYAGLVAVSLGGAGRHGVLGAVGAPRAASPPPWVCALVRTVLGGAGGRDLVPVLAATGLYEVAYAVLAALGVVIGVART